MKIAITYKDGIDQEMCKSRLKEIIEYTEVCENPDYVFSFGGDGTFLDAVNQYGLNPIYVPVNMGTLGFYSSWGPDGFAKLKEDLKQHHTIFAPSLDIAVYENTGVKHYFCINEMTLINPINTQILDVYVNGFEVEKFRGTGICVSTPTGSTAYNKSLGGAIYSQEKELFQLTHIAAINNVHYRSIGNSVLFGSDEILEFKTDENNYANTTLMVDRKTYAMTNVNNVSVALGEKKVQILVPQDNNFYKRVKSAFID